MYIRNKNHSLSKIVIPQIWVADILKNYSYMYYLYRMYCPNAEIVKQSRKATAIQMGRLNSL